MSSKTIIPFSLSLVLILGCAGTALPPPMTCFPIEEKPRKVDLIIKPVLGEKLCYESYSEYKAAGKRTKRERIKCCVETTHIQPGGNFTRVTSCGGKTSSVLSTPRGKVVSASGYASFMKAFDFSSPDYPVGPGDNWSYEITQTFFPDQKPIDIKLKMESRLEDFVVCGERKCAKISGQGVVSFIWGGYKMRCTFSGFSHFDYERGQTFQSIGDAILRATDPQTGQVWRESLHIFQELKEP